MSKSHGEKKILKKNLEIKLGLKSPKTKFHRKLSPGTFFPIIVLEQLIKSQDKRSHESKS